MELKQVGYQALVKQFDLEVIPHFQASFISNRNQRKTLQHVNGPPYVEEIYPKSYDPGSNLGDQLEFALKHEGVNLEILYKLFKKINPSSIIEYILSRKTGKHARRIWFLYEFLTWKKLDKIADLNTASYVDLLDKEKYYTTKPILSRRHRIYNNLLGDHNFSPLVRRTKLLKQYENQNLSEKTVQMVRRYPENIIARAVNFLYTKETRSSFQIEHEEPNETRVSRFIDILKEAGRSEFITHNQLIWLQNQIVDKRFTIPDYSTNQNYVGESIGLHRQNIHYVSPRPDAVSTLMNGLITCHQRMMTSEVHAVIHAAVTSFGFVFIHPFEDGNGRIHRFLMHHILAMREFTPEGIIFPISATLLRKRRKYDETLETFSKPLMPLVQYTLDDDGAMQVLNDTTTHYRFIDMTRICEAMFEFLNETINTELPSELDFLIKYDRTKKSLQMVIDMPDQKLDLFIKFCLQNNGHLSATKREKFFSMLNDEEIKRLEAVVRENM